MNHELSQIKTFTSTVLQNLLAAIPMPDNPFRLVTSLAVGEAGTPLLLVGNVHREFDDGYCIAVLNPDASLSKQLKPGVGYSSHILRELVSGHCDGMVAISIVGDDIRVTSTYCPRTKH